MAKISFSDSIFVSVYHLGLHLITLSLTGIDSQAALIRSLQAKLPAMRGKLVTLETRNATKGWSHTSPVLFAA